MKLLLDVDGESIHHVAGALELSTKTQQENGATIERREKKQDRRIDSSLSH